MHIPIKIIRRATAKSLLVWLDDDRSGFPVLWIPRSAIVWGESLEAGERDIVIDVATWMCKEIEEAFRRLQKARDGQRLLDMQFDMMRERKGTG